MRNSFRGLPCVYCAPATTDDHVIAAKFFLEPQRGNLPEVPACQRCNNEKSHLEDYLMVVLGFGAMHPHAKVNLDTLVRRRLENNLRQKRELEAGYDASSGASIPFNHEKLEKLFTMIAQGLAWHHWKVLLRLAFSPSRLSSVIPERRSSCRYSLAGRRRPGNPQIWETERSYTRVHKRPTFQKPRSGALRCMAASGSAAILVSPIQHRSR
jgi:hypothetical protein